MRLGRWLRPGVLFEFVGWVRGYDGCCSGWRGIDEIGGEQRVVWSR